MPARTTTRKPAVQGRTLKSPLALAEAMPWDDTRPDGHRHEPLPTALSDREATIAEFTDHLRTTTASPTRRRR